MRETTARISETVRTWRGVEVRIFSRHLLRRKYATEKKRPKKTTFVKYSEEKECCCDCEFFVVFPEG